MGLYGKKEEPNMIIHWMNKQYLIKRFVPFSFCTLNFADLEYFFKEKKCFKHLKMAVRMIFSKTGRI